ncbi:MAG: hypothetical protein QXS68_07955 [Candidatus Methanomethylicaceae archaeon]
MIDPTEDTNGQHLHRFLHMTSSDGSRVFQVPTFVKQARQEDILPEKPLPPGVYADLLQRKFPCHTPAATWVSALFFYNQKQASGDPGAERIERRLEAAGKFHNIGSYLESIKKTAERLYRAQPEPIPDEDYALVVQNGRTKERYLPIRSAAEVKAAQEYLQRHAHQMTLQERQSIANKILEKAAQHHVEVNIEILEPIAGIGFCTAEDASRAVLRRAQILHQRAADLAIQEQMAKIAMSLLQNPTIIHQPGKRQQLAVILEQVDHDHHLQHAVRPPEQELFHLTPHKLQKIASENVELTNGAIFRKNDIAELGPEALEELFGPELIQAVQIDSMFVDPDGLAQILATLPRGDAERLTQKLKDLDVQPVDSGPAQEKQGMSQKSLDFLASLFQKGKIR